MNMDMENQDIKITIILKQKPPTLLANANVSINTILYGFITIKGFQIWKSQNFNERLQEAINITPPMRLIYGRYISLVFIENPSKWHELELEIYNVYSSKRNNSQNRIEEVNIDEIPDNL